jgi:hypothetical protein
MRWYRYIWTAITVVTVGVNASENPFDPNENFKVIEQEQNSLLKELKVISETQGIADDIDDIDDDMGENIENSRVEEKPVPQESQKISQQTSVKTEESQQKSGKEDRVPAASDKKEIVRIEQIKEEQSQTTMAQKAEEEKLAKKAEEEKLAKKAEEEKLAKKAEAERQAMKRLEEERIARKEVEEGREAEKDEKAAAKVQKATSAEAKVAKISGVDINITREEMEARRKADELLQQAIEEVDQEDN